MSNIIEKSTLPVISIIMPVFNAANKVEKAISSVLTQENIEFELICIDDGSSDASLQILEKFAKKDTRIRILKQCNTGPGRARNLGIQAAKGEWIAFLDADDRFPNKYILSDLVKIADKYKVSIVGGNVDFYTLGGKYKKRYTECEFHYEGIVEFNELQNAFYFQRYLYKRAFLLENNIRFPNYQRYQDPPFLVQALLTANNIGITPSCSYCYTEHPAHVKWDIDKSVDFYNAVADVLDLSSENNLPVLHERTFQSLLNKKIMYFAIGNESDKLFIALKESYKHVNKSLLSNQDKAIQLEYDLIHYENLRKYNFKTLSTQMAIKSRNLKRKESIKSTIQNHAPIAYKLAVKVLIKLGLKSET